MAAPPSEWRVTHGLVKLQRAERSHAYSTISDIGGSSEYRPERRRDGSAVPRNVIKLIVPFGAGSQPDTIARPIGQQLSLRVGPIVVENRPGAGGLPGTQAAAGAPPEATRCCWVRSGRSRSVPRCSIAWYDAIKSFAPVALVSNAPFVLVVGPDVPVKTAQELVAHAKANPGKLNFGAGNASPPHLACDLFKRAAAINIVHVPYRTATLLSDLLKGEIQNQLRCHHSPASAHTGGKIKGARGDEFGAAI